MALLVMALSAGVAGTSPAASAAPSASEQQSAVPADLDSYIAGVLRTFDVPGVSVAIVKDGKVVLAKGYGVRKLGDATAVDDRTLFGIASNTKVFTAIALGLLVEEGKVGWDTPVIRLPAVVPVVRSVRHARADDPRPARAPQRARPGLRRSVVVAGLDLYPAGDRPPPEGSSARHELPQRLRLRQRPLPDCRRSHRECQRPVVGRLRVVPHPEESRHDREQRPPLRRHERRRTSRRRTRPWAARSCP